MKHLEVVVAVVVIVVVVGAIVVVVVVVVVAIVVADKTIGEGEIERGRKGRMRESERQGKRKG